MILNLQGQKKTLQEIGKFVLRWNLNLKTKVLFTTKVLALMEMEILL